MEIHENDIGKEKRVFLVTLPKNNIENLQICVGDAYSDESDNVKYNIYKVDKKTKKVTSTLGYYEFPKETKVLDDEGDFNVLDLGEDAMHIQHVKSAKSEKIAKPAKSEKPVKGKVKEYEPDADYYMTDYFNKNYQLKEEDIVPTFLENLVKPQVWSNQSVIEAVALFYNIYIVLVDDAIVDNNPGIVSVFPVLNGNYSPRKYVIVSFETRDHFQLVENALKLTQFDLEQLPEFLTDKFPEEHKQHLSGKPVSMPKYRLIETTKNGDCFWDSINRAVTGSDYDEDEITRMRRTVAASISQDPHMEQVRAGIVDAYHLYTTKNNDSVYQLVFPNPSKENREQFDIAFEYLFLKRDRVTKQLMPHVKNVREFTDEQQADLILAYLRTHDKDGNELGEPVVEVVDETKQQEEQKEEQKESEKPKPKIIIKPKVVSEPPEALPEAPPKAPPEAPPKALPEAPPKAPPKALPEAPQGAPTHTQDSLNKLTIPALKEILATFPGRKPLGTSKKQEIIDCILNVKNCKPSTKKNGGRVSGHYTRKL